MEIMLFSYDLSSPTRFAVAPQLWLRNMPFNMGSHDFATADKFGQNGWPIFGPMS